MSFKFTWPEFSPQFYEYAKQKLTDGLNKGEKPANIVDDIIVKDLNMGTMAPDLEILEIGELSQEKFRGIFKLVYAGDAFVVLQTKVQANPVSQSRGISIIDRTDILAANAPLVVPMQLQISNLKLRGIITLVIDKLKGVTLAFKNDPLEKVDVNSTFDNIPNIQRFLQAEIEKQLRKLFVDDIPNMVHTFSLGMVRELNMKKGSPSSSQESLNNGTSNVNTQASGSSGAFSTRAKWYGNESGDFHFDLTREELAKISESVRTRSPSALPSTTLFRKQRNKPKRDGLLKILDESSDEDDISSIKSGSSVSSQRRYIHRFNSQYRRLWSPSIPSSSNTSTPPLLSRSNSISSTMSLPAVLPQARSSNRDHSINRPKLTSSASFADFRSAGLGYSLTPGEEMTSTSRPGTPHDIVLNPSSNYMAAQLANLFNANQTISPYARTLEHSTFRSVPVSKLKRTGSFVGVSSHGISTDHPNSGTSSGSTNLSASHAPTNLSRIEVPTTRTISSLPSSPISSDLGFEFPPASNIGATPSTINPTSGKLPAGYVVHQGEGGKVHYHFVRYYRLGKKGKRCVRKRVFTVNLKQNKD
ncbi:hypothetical protein BKA69DRAFT_1050435 [Paraphysoderma sedebokerense]|nr:hypothetical protein BKA69DRAFT_1050435 [Paraphysoderma sedebokerense]